MLPHGLYYGRLDPVTALAVAGHHAAGNLDLDHLRGRSGLPMPVQAAEIALRRELGETRADALRLVDRRTDGPDTEAVFAVGGATYAVVVRTTHGRRPPAADLPGHPRQPGAPPRAGVGHPPGLTRRD